MAVTGGTGFVGKRLLDRAVTAGHSVRALARREQDPRDGITWISGSLEDRASLHLLCEGADAIIHVAGVINAYNRAGFEAGNVTGTAAILESAHRKDVRRFVHVSSLAAREPKLSDYGASKARSEELVRDSGLDWAIVRPPAVYGPGDKEMLELFKMAKRGFVLLPPDGRFSLMHANDVADLLIALADPPRPSKLTLEPDDGHPGGWTHRQFASLLGAVLGRDPATFSAPAPLVRGVAWLDRLLRGRNAKLTPDRAGYFCHPDWVSSKELAPPPELWAPRIKAREGLGDTARWYEANGWL